MELKEMKKLERNFLYLSDKLIDSDKFLFMNLFSSLKTHIAIMEGLEKSIFTDGAMIEKEYVKNRPSLTANPAITQYNATSKAACTVINSLMKFTERVAEETPFENNIIKKLKGKSK